MGPRVVVWVQVQEGTVSRIEGEAPRQVLPHEPTFAAWIQLGWRPVSAAASSLPMHDVVVLEYSR